MNVIVSNRQKDIIDNANIDAIKDLRGLFNVDDLINKFKNYVFSKMLLDATSVINFASKEVLEKLVSEIGADRLIILLPSNPEPPVEFVKLLIDLKIYNFTTDINEAVKFIDNPNKYEDAIKAIDGSFNNNMYVDNSIKDTDDHSDEDEDNNQSNEIGTGKSLGDILNNFNLNNSDDNEDDDNDESDDEQDESEEEDISVDENEENVEIPDYGLSEQTEETKEENDTNVGFGGNTFLISDSLDNANSFEKPEVKKKVIGFKNVTLHAGSTSLIYMIHKMTILDLKMETLSIEVGKDDFKFYRDRKMVSVGSDKIKDIIDDAKETLILVDLNECNDLSFCDEVIYLVEPSTIMLNKLMVENKNIFNELKDNKVVLNKSLLTENDIRTLSSEAGMEFFDNIKPLNDRIHNDVILKFIDKLNIN